MLARVDALSDGAWPNGIALDHLAERLYWIDARSDSIHTTTYEGGDYREVLRGHEALSHPFAITVFESHVYWTDWRSNSVVRANKWNGSSVAVVQRTLTQPFDIKVIHPSRQPRGANPCGAHNGGCSHLCLIDAPAARLCACPHLMRLADDQRTCEAHEKVLLVGREGEIRGVDVEEPLVPIVPTISGPDVTAPTNIQFLAADYNVYWADTEVQEIKVARLTGGPVRAAAWRLGGAPRGLALDWAARTLYYCAAAALTAAGTDGQFAAELLRDPDLAHLSALVVDPLRGQMYWALGSGASGGARVEAARGDASARRTLLLARDQPLLAAATGMVMDVDNNRLYWINSGTATIQYYDVDTGKLSTVSLLIVIGKYVWWPVRTLWGLCNIAECQVV
ncbi:unnamed protein product [Parnassius mnemosyne]|uniref:Uncharacterized protein n=1 Tax=Parnassius mnemosyne TaxID=213953 RepID=A0AAV1L6A6_9NEOP